MDDVSARGATSCMTSRFSRPAVVVLSSKNRSWCHHYVCIVKAEEISTFYSLSDAEDSSSSLLRFRSLCSSTIESSLLLESLFGAGTSTSSSVSVNILSPISTLSTSSSELESLLEPLFFFKNHFF